MKNRRRAVSAISRIIMVIIIVVIIVIAGTAAVFLSTIGKSTNTTSTSSSTSAGNQTLVVDNTLGEPNCLDIDCGTVSTADEINQNMYQTLLWYRGNSTTNIVGVLATNWTISSDGLTYTFSLVHNARYSDGRNFTAYDVWFNYYRYTVDNGPISYIIGSVIFNNLPSNATADLNTFNFSNPTLSQISQMANANQSIQVTNPYTVVFHFKTPIASFLSRLASFAAGIEEPNYIQAHGGVFGNGTLNNYVAQNPAPGTGPYMFKSWIHGQSITLVQNPYYWRAKPQASTVVIRYVTNTLTAINDLKSGTARMLYSVPFPLLSNIQNVTGIKLQSGGLSLDIAWLALNVNYYPLNITSVRLAINYAINKSALIQSAIAGYGVPFQGPIPIGMLGGNSSLQPIGYNVSMSEQLLAQAGFPRGSGIPNLNLLYVTGNPSYDTAVEIIQSQLAAIGINVILQGVTYAVFGNIVADHSNPNYPPMVLAQWFPDYGFPDDYAYPFENPSQCCDYSNFNNTQMTDLTNRMVITVNTTAQLQIDQQVLLLDKQLSPEVWLWQTEIGFGVPAYSSSITGLYYNPLTYGFNYSSVTFS
jgi:peptide/nickel transport system substrate-binding protein